MSTIMFNLNGSSWRFVKYANVRFDRKLQDDISFHDNIKDLNASVYSHMVGSEQKLEDGVESNILDVIENYLLNNQSPLCGSVLTIIMKRNPIRNNTERLVQLLQDNHIMLRIVGSDQMLGGSDSMIMYNMAVQTNGLYIFTYSQYTDVFYNSFKWAVYSPTSSFLFYAQNIAVTGKGTLGLPSFLISGQDFVILVNTEMNVQNHGLTDEINTIQLFVGNQSSGFSLEIDCNKWTLRNQTVQFGGSDLMTNISQPVSLNYDYKTDNIQKLEFRFWSTIAPSDWLAYPTGYLLN
ncbi:hypothetical protein GCK72_021867 [Caenorhabditis remanei]|uniref:DUF7154 domain-containing protein n=1 Tax=Caenorhabditis remanei TaxID=31234 RepID=A0A6A5GJ98_CAERE|nr:hypothetical protein GCK72_021867 [Caenorhabditis remanei]KAF1755298.1 hypothetical protein GCK72_021867 [Caenorhabditis remanei]